MPKKHDFVLNSKSAQKIWKNATYLSAKDSFFAILEQFLCFRILAAFCIRTLGGNYSRGLNFGPDHQTWNINKMVNFDWINLKFYMCM